MVRAEGRVPSEQPVLVASLDAVAERRSELVPLRSSSERQIPTVTSIAAALRPTQRAAGARA
jgi:hypothetical protein